MTKEYVHYDPKICEDIPAMFEEGESIVEVAKKLKISRRAFYDWMEKHEEFNEAVEEGLSLAEAWWAKLGRAGAAGAMTVNAPVWIFNMKNRYKWTDRTETDNTHKVTDLSSLLQSVDGKSKTVDGSD